MSEQDKPMRVWVFFSDMRGFAEKVLACTDGMRQQAFVDSGITYDATLRNLELIGEAATHGPESVRQAHPEIPWRLIVSTLGRGTTPIV